MKRKEFIGLGTLASLGLFLGYSPLKGKWSTTSDRGTFLSIGASSKLYTNKGGAVGIFESEEGYIVVDSQFPDSIKEVLQSIEKKGKPILYLANTHHHGDHTSGNFSFTELTKGIVAQRTVPDSQRNSAAESGKLNEQKYATILFDTEFKFDLAGKTMRGYHFGVGHTNGDAIYHWENDNVVHMGDLVFRDMIPVYRTKDGADILGWIEILQKTKDKFDSETKFIFGHAPSAALSVGSREDLTEMENFLDASANFIAKAIQNQISTDELVSKHQFIPGFENRLTQSRFSGFLEQIRITIESKSL